MGVWKGGDKTGLHIKDKFFFDVEGGKMGTWGITMRQSHYGLDPLRAIVDTRLKTVDFLSFHAADALELIKAVIIEEIRWAYRGCPAADLVSYFSENFPPQFYSEARLIAECLADHYRTGELIVYEYTCESCEPVEHRIINVVLQMLFAKAMIGSQQEGFHIKNQGVYPAQGAAVLIKDLIAMGVGSLECSAKRPKDIAVDLASGTNGLLGNSTH